ncbi:MAG: hypothetical protein H6Q55_3115 [Deltaproteobacteria bacterium]|jgi:hypothetical protein|nr:hypothetical protein [Deltaproteobacteria bacterium]
MKTQTWEEIKRASNQVLEFAPKELCESCIWYKQCEPYMPIAVTRCTRLKGSR